MTAVNDDFHRPKCSPNNSVPSMDVIIEAYCTLDHLKAVDPNIMFKEKVVCEMVRNFTCNITCGLANADDEDTIQDQLAGAYPFLVIRLLMVLEPISQSQLSIMRVKVCINAIQSLAFHPLS